MGKSDPASGDEKVVVEHTRSEALVLFEFLARWSGQGSGNIHLEHPSEQRVLSDIEAMLESALVEPLMPDYSDHLAKARQAVQDTTS